MSSEEVYNGEKGDDFDRFAVLRVDIRSELDADEMHLVGRKCGDRDVDKGNAVDVRDRIERDSTKTVENCRI